MAVELRPSPDFFLCPSQLSPNQTDVVEDAVDRAVSDHYTELTSSSGSRTDTDTDTETSNDDELAELTRLMAAHFTSDQGFGARLSTKKVDGDSEEGFSNETAHPSPPVIEKRQDWDKTPGITAMEKTKIGEQKYPPVTKDRSRIDQQIRVIQLYKMKQELGRRDLHGPERAQQGRNWPNHRLNVSGSGMRAVFLERSGSKSRPGPSGGTGVFLPAAVGDASHSRKKKGCSPVLIPAKVMQALKIHFDRMANVSPHYSPLQHDNCAAKPNGVLRPENKRQPQTVPAATQNDICLPQDWTY